MQGMSQEPPSDSMRSVGLAAQSAEKPRTASAARDRVPRIPLLALAAALAAAGGGCSRQAEPIFDSADLQIAWPPPPAQSRVRWVGELRTTADLKAGRNFIEVVGEVLMGAEEPARLYGPRGVTLTAGNKLWVADPGGRCVHVFDLEGRRYQKVLDAGSSKLLSPVDVCPGPNGSVYVCDSEAGEIHQFAGEAMTLMRSLSRPTELSRPAALAFGEEANELYVVDVAAHDIKVLDPRGMVKRVLGGRGRGPGRFNFPCDVLVDGDTLWVADTGNNRVQAISREGEPLIAFGQPGDSPGDMAMPKSVAVDSDGHVYVVDARFENIQIFDREGRLLLAIGQEGTGPGEFWLPGGIHIDSRDRIWVCDSYNARVQVFDYVPAATDSRTGDGPAGEAPNGGAITDMDSPDSTSQETLP